MILYNDKNLDKRKVMVMSEETWSSIKTHISETTPSTDNTNGYFARYSGIDVYIDNELPLNETRIYEKWLYDAIQLSKKNLS